MAIPAIGAAAPFVPPTISAPTSSPGGAGKTGGASFAKSLDAVQQLQSQADTAATGVATGNLTDIHQFTAAAAKASLGVELTAALRDRAVGAYQEIMRMQV